MKEPWGMFGGVILKSENFTGLGVLYYPVLSFIIQKYSCETIKSNILFW
ncbi:hypothetical protein AAJ76_1100029067 [Vairimorpha ceranae]|uniref:Uncharacterized protein n=1 Tax=Vairimorpha ceranae TaxID=40302 RepID=A0A0F9WSH7_9MICR|nr:hypothetical protein AAJ76_1100029067 [Vairimorpha ceranae]KKO75818.1 hypothetical protein AAJ76_1100029067 [Vairimorpha ceranae]